MLINKFLIRLMKSWLILFNSNSSQQEDWLSGTGGLFYANLDCANGEDSIYFEVDHFSWYIGKCKAFLYT